MIPNGFRAERLRVAKLGDYISSGFKDGPLSLNGSIARVRQHKRTAARWDIFARWTNPCGYGSFHTCRHRTVRIHLGRVDVYGGVSEQQSAAIRD